MLFLYFFLFKKKVCSMFAVSMLVVTTTTVELTVATGIGTLRMSDLLRVYESSGFTTIKDHTKSTHAHRVHERTHTRLRQA